MEEGRKREKDRDRCGGEWVRKRERERSRASACACVSVKTGCTYMDLRVHLLTCNQIEHTDVVDVLSRTHV